MRGKTYCIALDGAADHRLSILGNHTPLEIAHKPFLDFITQKGQMSFIEILPKSHVPETDSGVMALLGYDPLTYYCGRGGLETIGNERYKQYRYFAGFRVNFASLNRKNNCLNRRTARNLTNEELQALTTSITNAVTLDTYPDIHYELIAYGTHRGIFSLYSNTTELSGNVSNTDPGFEKRGFFSFPVQDYRSEIQQCIALDDTQASKVTADIVNEFIAKSHAVLDSSPINASRIAAGNLPCNYLISRDGGSILNPLMPFEKKYGKKLAIYGGLPCEKGIANLIDVPFYYSQALKLQLDSNYLTELAHTLVDSSAEIVFCHLKGPDEFGHDRDPLGKVKAIELIDSAFFGELIPHITAEDILVVTCDHATPCDLGIHSNDNVPLVVMGKNIRADQTSSFDESNAVLGSCPVKKATEVMGYIVKRGKNE